MNKLSIGQFHFIIIVIPSYREKARNTELLNF